MLMLKIKFNHIVLERKCHCAFILLIEIKEAHLIGYHCSRAACLIAPHDNVLIGTSLFYTIPPLLVSRLSQE